MLLWHLIQDIQCSTTHQTKISRILRDVDVDHPAEQTVKQVSGGFFERSLAFALDALTVNNVSALVHQTHHVGQELRRILQVGIQDENPITPSQRQPCGQRQLMTVVAR